MIVSLLSIGLWTVASPRVRTVLLWNGVSEGYARIVMGDPDRVDQSSDHPRTHWLVYERGDSSVFVTIVDGTVYQWICKG